METATANFDIQRTTKSRLDEFDPKKIVFGTQFADHMLVADCIDGEWQTPKILPYGEIAYNPAMASLHYG
jgi:branched-chain amino acid aminotransferase